MARGGHQEDSVERQSDRAKPADATRTRPFCNLSLHVLGSPGSTGELAKGANAQERQSFGDGVNPPGESTMIRAASRGTSTRICDQKTPRPGRRKAGSFLERTLTHTSRELSWHVPFLLGIQCAGS
jgi:hypothetical protein